MGKDKRRKEKQEYKRPEVIRIPVDLKQLVKNTTSGPGLGEVTGCFPKGIGVLTNKGLKNIEDIRLGNRLLSYNKTIQKNEYTKVIKLFTFVRDEVVEFEFSDGLILRCTAPHPFYVIGKEWVKAEELNPGDELKDKDGEIVKIDNKRVIKLNNKIPVYNIEVDGNHNYYVGMNNILVHNKIPVGC